MNPHRKDGGASGRMAKERRKARARREWTPPAEMKLVQTAIGSAWVRVPQTKGDQAA